MSEAFALETPLWEIVVRGTVVYLTIAFVLRIMPKRHTGNLVPNDMASLIIVGSLGASAITGAAKALPDQLLMILIVILWDYLFNLADYYSPHFRSMVQDSPTLLIHDGIILTDNLRKEKLSEQELAANLRKQGISDLAKVQQAILEVDGRISVVKKD